MLNESDKFKISIIVPIYNVEKFLDKCIQSLINQTYKNIEIILVDDGSPDSCPEMCNEWVKRDSRIKVIHKENGGLSEARNFGLNKSSGDYILFVDSDDYIELDTCENFLLAIGKETPEIVVGNAKRIESKKTFEMSHNNNTNGIVVTGQQYLLMELKAKTMYMAACLNLYSKKYLVDNELFFKIGLLHEDEHFTPRAFLKANKIIGTNITFYNYVIRNCSITKNKDLSKNAIHCFETYKELSELYSLLSDAELKSYLLDSIAEKYLDKFQVGKMYRKEYQKYIDKRFLCGKALTKKNKFKVGLFLLNKRLYYLINLLSKKLGV